MMSGQELLVGSPERCAAPENLLGDVLRAICQATCGVERCPVLSRRRESAYHQPDTVVDNIHRAAA